jgi:hypothetical protein
MTDRFKHDRKRACGDMIHRFTREWFLSETTKTKTTTTTTTTMTGRNVLKEEMEDGHHHHHHHHHHHPNDPNMMLVDFGLQVEPRVYDEKRIEGDHVFHFGSEARTLSIQMLSHAIQKSICRKRNDM